MQTFIRLLIIGAGGFVGAILRYTTSAFVERRTGGAFPSGTMAVNVLGCLVLGVLAYMMFERLALGPNARMFWTVGLLGAFTTFSTFSLETLVLIRDGSAPLALLNIGASVLLGLAAVWVGYALPRLAGL